MSSRALVPPKYQSVTTTDTDAGTATCGTAVTYIADSMTVWVRSGAIRIPDGLGTGLFG